MTFRLEKWFLDVLGTQGDLSIIYAADVAFAGVRVGVNALTEYTTGEGVSDHSSLVGARLPERTKDGVRWSNDRLLAEGLWQGFRGAFPERTLYAADGKSIRWECVAPAAAAQVSTPRGIFTGTGYVERLQLTLEPWRLPISTLRWGRFSTGARSVVWIQWRGAHPIDLVIVDGVERSAVAIDEHHVTWENGAIRLQSPRTLRDAPIGTGALSWIPRLANALSIPLLKVHETKWLSAATLEDGTEPDTREDGFALHELVRFPAM
ncbi:MAG: hypothetical protein SGJ11_18465 [Phycisphaerae bacterium]|nr:hypothetical protein [Phycisphaerae bacterium]